MTKAAAPLMSPFTVDGLTLKNRIVLAPMTRGRAGVERIPNELMAEYYRQRSSAGLIITEATSISEQGLGWVNSPGIYTEAQVAGWKLVTEAVHEAGAPIFMQLWHCGRASHSSFRQDRSRGVSASAIVLNEETIHTPEGKQAHETPRALLSDEILGVVEDYRQAAARAQEAGFDGVEIHAANGYLLDQFLQSKINHRTDGYGGSIENRTRLLQEVLEAVLTMWSEARVGVRLSPNGAFNDMGSPEYREQFCHVAGMLDEHKIGYLHLMDGLAFGFHELGEPVTLAEARAVFHGPLIGNCGYTEETATAAVEAGHADLIAFGAVYYANPDLVERFAAGWLLAPAAPVTVWSKPGAEGYTDYPRHGETADATT